MERKGIQARSIHRPIVLPCVTFASLAVRKSCFAGIPQFGSAAAGKFRRVFCGIDHHLVMRGGNRVEIKGVARAAYAVKLVHNEAIRQVNLLKIRDALAARNENMARAFSPHLGGARGLALRARLV